MAPGELGRFFIRLFPVPLSCFSISTYLICFLLDRPRIQRYGQRGSPDRGQRTPPKLVQTTERILSLLKRNPFESSHAFSEKVSQGGGISTMKNLRPRSVSPELLRKIAPAPGFSRKQGDAWLPYPAGDAMEIPLFSQGPLIKRGRKGIYM